MITSNHPADDPGEFLELHRLLGPKRMPFEKRHDEPRQVVEVPDPQAESIACVSPNHAAPERCPQSVKKRDVPLVLNDRELGKELKPELEFFVS